jgi:hypothetical protein
MVIQAVLDAVKDVMVTKEHMEKTVRPRREVLEHNQEIRTRAGCINKENSGA